MRVWPAPRSFLISSQPVCKQVQISAADPPTALRDSAGGAQSALLRGGTDVSSKEIAHLFGLLTRAVLAGVRVAVGVATGQCLLGLQAPSRKTRLQCTRPRERRPSYAAPAVFTRPREWPSQDCQIFEEISATKTKHPKEVPPLKENPNKPKQ